MGTSINSSFCKNFNNCWISEYFCALFVFGLHLSDFHSITMPPHCAFAQAKHLLFQNSKITTKEFIEVPMSKKIVFFCAKKSNISKFCVFLRRISTQKKCSNKTFVYLRQPSRTLFVLCLFVQKGIINTLLTI